MVRVDNNLVRIPVVPLDRPRFGIFLGNVKRAWLLDNDVALESADSSNPRLARALAARLQHTHSEGIHFYGSVDTMLQIRGNAVQRCRQGIALTTIGSTGNRLRLIEGNVVQGAVEAFKGVGGSTQKAHNVPQI